MPLPTPLEKIKNDDKHHERICNKIKKAVNNPKINIQIMEMIAQVEKEGWMLFASGNYNAAFFKETNNNQVQVLKIPLYFMLDEHGCTHTDYDHPERNSRLWNFIYNKIHKPFATAEMCEVAGYRGTVFPYIEPLGVAPDYYVAKLLHDLYLETQRVVVDIVANGNVYVAAKDPGAKEKNLFVAPLDLSEALNRRDSDVSQSHWMAFHNSYSRSFQIVLNDASEYVLQYDDFLSFYEQSKPLSVAMIKALLFLDALPINAESVKAQAHLFFDKKDRCNTNLIHAYALLYDLDFEVDKENTLTSAELFHVMQDETIVETLDRHYVHIKSLQITEPIPRCDRDFLTTHQTHMQILHRKAARVFAENTPNDHQTWLSNYCFELYQYLLENVIQPKLPKQIEPINPHHLLSPRQRAPHRDFGAQAVSSAPNTPRADDIKPQSAP